MSAFSEAWALLKMPIVPGSLKRNPVADEQPNKNYAGRDNPQYSALFHDPKSKETSEMYVALGDWGKRAFDLSPDVVGGIKHPTDPNRDTASITLDTLRNLGYPKSEDDGIKEPWLDDYLDSYFSTGSGVDDEYRRRGQATALYDMVARIIRDEEGQRFRPSEGLSFDAMKLWHDKTGGSHWNTASWPVRDDL